MGQKDLPPIGQRLRSFRELSGMTQQDLAQKAGLSVSIVARLEQGAKSDPRVSTLQALANGLGIEIGQLTDREVKELPRTKGKGK